MVIRRIILCLLACCLLLTACGTSDNATVIEFNDDKIAISNSHKDNLFVDIDDESIEIEDKKDTLVELRFADDDDLEDALKHGLKYSYEIEEQIELDCAGTKSVMFVLEENKDDVICFVFGWIVGSETGFVARSTVSKSYTKEIIEGFKFSVKSTDQDSKKYCPDFILEEIDDCNGNSNQDDERRDAQKDDSAMGEVTNAIMLSLADQDVYDEMLYYVCTGNVSCYIDSNSEPDKQGLGYIQTRREDPDGKYKAQYMYNDDCRLKDQTVFYAAGNMSGVTFTFQPERHGNGSKYIIANAIVNKFVQTDGNTCDQLVQSTNLLATGRDADDVGYKFDIPNYAHQGVLGNFAFGSSKINYLYNRVRATVGDEVEIKSNTYRNSEYTIFVRLQQTNGNDSFPQDAIVVYGQWNGTHLP